MSQIQTSTVSSTEEFLPPPYDQPHVRRQFDDLLKEVADVIAPVWPLKDYVAVNPYAGIAQRDFFDARSFLKAFSDCETLMPMPYFAEAFANGRFSPADLEQAINELKTAEAAHAEDLCAKSIVEKLQSIPTVEYPSGDVDEIQAAPNLHRAMRTFTEYLGDASEVDWTETICDEVSKFCGSHYDEGQAAWESPWKDLSLFQAWRSMAELDRNVESLGLTGFRKFAASLPHSADAAIVALLQTAEIPEHLWSAFLLCQAFSIPGWSAWAKYKSAWTDDSESEQQDFAGLIAIRLAYDVAVQKKFDVLVDWSTVSAKESASFRASHQAKTDDSLVRYALLRATEIAYRNELVGSLDLNTGDQVRSTRKLAQMVFCIDVRSERIRRQLETVSDGIETFGFAGFFGMPIEFVPLGHTCGNSHVPVLLKPALKLHEGLHDDASTAEETVIEDRSDVRSWRNLWKGFQASAVGCFSFVETTGLLYGWKLLRRAIGIGEVSIDGRLDGLKSCEAHQLGPTLRGLNQQGITTTAQVDLAQSMLKNLGLVKQFGRLVVFCGHACSTDNNPLAAGLDCGACGGHSGEPNARFAAMLLNQSYIRKALAERGIVIPQDTHFLGGLHNTTTDTIELFDLQEVPETHQSDLEELQAFTDIAGQRTREERMPIVDSSSMGDLLRRSGDWSEVRPEWGLAGNAAFIVGPRSITKNTNLDGRTFLHSYDHGKDLNGAVLETIMTAPMIVAHWINMQYYASTVDNHHFGSGNKTVHNVVGRFGVLSGGGGDLMTGLPWQSLHSGKHLQHLPLRLQVVIAAPKSAIDRIIEQHEMVSDLLNGNWLHLIAIEDGVAYRFVQSETWEPVDGDQDVLPVPLTQ